VHVTSVFVTHDQEEALEVSDRVVIMNEGRVEQSGTPEEVYENPATPFVYGFLGDVNLFHGRIDRGRVQVGGSELEAPEWAEARDQAGVAYVRTYDVELTPSASGKSSIEAVVRHIRAFGPVVRLELDRTEDGSSIEAHIPRAQHEQLGLTKGQRVFVSPTSVRVFARPSDPGSTRTA
jgi:sulfate/thiosulfate transport system ATP-binding protein